VVAEHGSIASRRMHPDSLRAEFPVLERLAYLNAGTDGPVPAAAARAARAALEDQLMGGRWTPHFEARMESGAALRESYARVLGCTPDDVALTTSTSEGIGMVLAGLDLGPGDEIVTSDQEHPGLLGPLRAARDRGATIRMVAFRDLADAIGPQTRLVACSHVSWVGGEVAPAALADAGIPVILDGAQGAGAVPVDVAALGCAAYAAAGQKWLCGADGTGMLYLAPAFRERVRAIAPSYMSFSDASQGIDAPLRETAQRFDTPSLSRESIAFSRASLAVLEEAGLPEVHERAAALADTLVSMLGERGRTVAPRGRTTLVAWEEDDPAATRARLVEAGVVLRDLPGRPYLRASVGAWNDESDLSRLVEAL
jgi:selenocysteine lyase/cysteine desulfurase